MPVTTKKNESKTNYGPAAVSKDVKDYTNDPVFVKKTAIAKEVLEKYGFPDQKKK